MKNTGGRLEKEGEMERRRGGGGGRRREEQEEEKEGQEDVGRAWV